MTFIYHVRAFGLPLPALRHDETSTFSMAFDAFGYHNDAAFPYSGYVVGNDAWPGAYPTWVVPVVPFWSGFVIDALFWAWISLLLGRLVTAARAARRLARGLCPVCRYPIGSVPTCAECGSAIPGGLCKPREQA